MTLYSYKSLVILLAGLILMAPTVRAMGERPQETMEIPGEEQRKIEEAREVPGPEEIREIERTIPEIPKPAKETGLSDVEKQKLDELERKRASGSLTQTEYDMEKDSVARPSNITF